MTPKALSRESNKFLKPLEKEIDNFKFYFLKQYFEEPTDVYWIADDIGGVLAVNDYFFSLQEMMDFVKYGYSKEDIFNYYDYSLSLAKYHVNTPKVNIKNWIKAS